MSASSPQRYQGPLQAAIFDWAGTTVDYGCCAPAFVFVEVYKRRGVELSVEQARGPMGMHKKAHLQELSKDPEIAARWEAAQGKPCGEDDIQAMFEEFVPLQCDCLTEYADLIPGTIETIAALRERGMKIGSTTGYTTDMMAILEPEAKARGYAPDFSVCANEVPAGRPEPWMCFANAQKLGVYPMESVVKIGDTAPDVAEGLNAGMWTIAVAKTGNEMGLSLAEVEALAEDEYQSRLARARARLTASGAHYVVDSIADVLPCLDDINDRLAREERP